MKVYLALKYLKDNRQPMTQLDIEKVSGVRRDKKQNIKLFKIKYGVEEIEGTSMQLEKISQNIIEENLEIRFTDMKQFEEVQRHIIESYEVN